MDAENFSRAHTPCYTINNPQRVTDSLQPAMINADKNELRPAQCDSTQDTLREMARDMQVALYRRYSKSELPAILMHDSPREADLGISHYHRLFRLLHELEDLGKEAPFQYIITTTTEPPKEIQNSDSLAVTLDGADVENKQLRRDFTGGLETS